jgi:hypothetical protein
MNIQKIDAILAQILVTAGALEDFKERGLGPIHFIKYLYIEKSVPKTVGRYIGLVCPIKWISQ